MNENMNLCQMYKPSRVERFWRKAGFTTAHAELPEGIEATHPGWMMTNTRMHFSFGDRLRLLLTGRLHLTLRQATSQEVDEAVSAMSHRILYPGESW